MGYAASLVLQSVDFNNLSQTDLTEINTAITNAITNADPNDYPDIAADLNSWTTDWSTNEAAYPTQVKTPLSIFPRRSLRFVT